MKQSPTEIRLIIFSASSYFSKLIRNHDRVMGCSVVFIFLAHSYRFHYLVFFLYFQPCLGFSESFLSVKHFALLLRSVLHK